MSTKEKSAKSTLYMHAAWNAQRCYATSTLFGFIWNIDSKVEMRQSLFDLISAWIQNHLQSEMVRTGSTDSQEHTPKFQSLHFLSILHSPID